MKVLNNHKEERYLNPIGCNISSRSQQVTVTTAIEKLVGVFLLMQRAHEIDIIYAAGRAGVDSFFFLVLLLFFQC